jgi:hypothetical protein
MLAPAKQRMGNHRISICQFKRTVDMPTLKDIPGPYRFFFYSFDCNEAMHVHVQRERMICKFWIKPLALARNHGFSAKELNTIREIITRIVTE